ncbi:phosphatidylinositol transfer protein 5-like [Mobula hypostoma]|uniref:phosphatidylinositol transfer protein 5-like n=1 Tax=Mobula hypostoma TaxID=723540 RepID=UPI002FC3ACAE
MLLKEYRICMPLTVEEYRIGQLYTISKHSHEQSDKGEGVEVVKNEPHEDPVHGKGQFTEKRVHLSSKLPSWARAVVPRIFYITEKAWNYYPYTITGKENSRCSAIETILKLEVKLHSAEIEISFICHMYIGTNSKMHHLREIKSVRIVLEAARKCCHAPSTSAACLQSDHTSLECGRKLEHLTETHVVMQRTYKFLIDCGRNQTLIGDRWQCKVIILTVMLPCPPNFTHQQKLKNFWICLRFPFPRPAILNCNRRCAFFNLENTKQEESRFLSNKFLASGTKEFPIRARI